MDSISRNLDGFSCAILGNRTFIAGVLNIEDSLKGYIFADDFHIIDSETEIPLILSRIKPLTTVKTKNKSYKGTLIQKTDKTATIELADGSIITTEYETIATQPFPSHQFDIDKKINLKVQLCYRNGLDYEIISHLIKRNPSSMIVQQQVKLLIISLSI